MMRSVGLSASFLMLSLVSYSECFQYKAADILFVVDGSGSVGKTNFNRMKEWLSAVSTDLMTEMGSAAHIGIITYSTNYDAPLRIGECGNPECVREKIAAMEYEGKSTHTSDALKFALEEGFPHSERFSTAGKVLIHITDGMARYWRRLLPWYETAKEMGVMTASIGVGTGVKLRQLKMVANGDTSKDRVFLSKRYSTLPAISSSITSMVYDVYRSPFTCDPIDVMFVVDGSASIREANFEKVRKWLITTCSQMNDFFGNQARVGVYQFSHYYDDRDYSQQIVEIPFRIGDCPSTECMEMKIQAMPHLHSTTFTYHALQRVLDIEFPYSPRAHYAKKVIVLITDGRASDGDMLPDWYAESLTQEVTSYAIGVGNYTLHQLRMVANGGESDENVFTTNDYGHLPKKIVGIIADRFGACPDYE